MNLDVLISEFKQDVYLHVHKKQLWIRVELKTKNKNYLYYDETASIVNGHMLSSAYITYHESSKTELIYLIWPFNLTDSMT